MQLYADAGLSGRERAEAPGDGAEEPEVCAAAPQLRKGPAGGRQNHISSARPSSKEASCFFGGGVSFTAPQEGGFGALGAKEDVGRQVSRLATLLVSRDVRKWEMPGSDTS